MVTSARRLQRHSTRLALFDSAAYNESHDLQRSACPCAAMDGYKILVTYNYLTHRELEYRRFMIQRWLPAMQELGFEPLEVLHTMWGNYPSRLIVLSAPDMHTVQRIMSSNEWQEWHQQLYDFVRNLKYRVVPARPWFQF